jgi:peptidoglycan hydrolase CwlO-like protein
MARFLVLYYSLIELNRKKVLRLTKITGENYKQLQNQIDMLFISNKDIITIYDNKMKDVINYQEKLADKLHNNILNLQEMIGKTNCETVHITETIHTTKDEIEGKISKIIKMQQKMVVYIENNINELKTHYNKRIENGNAIEID